MKRSLFAVLSEVDSIRKEIFPVQFLYVLTLISYEQGSSFFMQILNLESAAPSIVKGKYASFLSYFFENRFSSTETPSAFSPRTTSPEKYNSNASNPEIVIVAFLSRLKSL